MKKEQIIMWGSVLLVIIVLGLAFSGGENNYLNPSGNRNPANQKLMVVDQDTGEISFIQKSLQGVNQDVTDREAQISNALRNLLGDNLSNYAEYTKSGNNGVINQLKLDVIDRRVRDIAGVRQRLDNLEKKWSDFLTSYTASDMQRFLHNKIDNGQRIDLRIGGPGGHNRNTHRICDDRGDNNFSSPSEKVFWCDMNHFGTKGQKYVMPDLRIHRA